MIFPKIAVGKPNLKRNLFNLSSDVTTTNDIGVVQPLLVRELIPHTSIALSCKNFVRLAPMVAPTFGRLSYRTYSCFVPVSDVFEPFDNFIGEQPYNNGTLSYIPTQVPCLSVADITKFLCYIGGYVRFMKLNRSNPLKFTFSKLTDEEYNTITTYSPLRSSIWIESAQNNFVSIFKHDVGNHETRENELITPDTADMIFQVTDSVTNGFCALIRFDKKARRLRSFLKGCGFELDLNNYNDKINLIPFVSTYKAYFEIFGIKRNYNWQDTYNCRVMRNFANNPSFIGDTWHNFAQLAGMFEEWSDTFYTSNPDFVSSHLDTLSSNQNTRDIPFYFSEDDETISDSIYTQTPDQQPSLQSVPTSTSLKILERLTSRINKNTAFGRRLDLILKNLYGAEYHHGRESNFIGSNITPCNISDVMSTADTASTGGSYLGEYAGRGIGFSDGKGYDHFDTDKKFGYLVVLSALVPESTYCQALDPNLLHNERYDFYTGDYDALGFQATPQNAVLGETSINGITGSPFKSSLWETFGFIPRYTECKVAPPNKLNGDINLRSLRKSYLPYTLDRYMTTNELYNNGDDTYMFSEGCENSLSAGTAWRYLTKFGSTSNFNRIFQLVNSPMYGAFDPTPDHFIIHNVLDLKINAPMLSISNSFDTDAFGDSVTVDKA